MSAITATPPPVDPRPELRLPGSGTLLSSVATKLGKILGQHGCFSRSAELVVWDHEEKSLRPINAELLRTYAEKHVRFYYDRSAGKRVFQSLSLDSARALIVSTQLHAKLPTLRRVNPCRQPVLRENNSLELLPFGFDSEFKTLTLYDVDYPEDMTLEAAQNVLRRVFAEFAFFDPDLSLAIAVAMMVGLFTATMLGETQLRPALIILANAEGAGKSLLAKIIILTVLGRVPVGVRPEREEELEKLLLTCVREGRQILFLDNVRGALVSSKLEAFITAVQWSGRLLGRNETYTGPNLATVFITGNGLTVSPDLRRRSLFIELMMREERAEDRVFTQTLDDDRLTEMRPDLLAALWALVRNWYAAGRPKCSRSHSAFPLFAEVVGGIVEAAGFACPFDEPKLTQPVDRDGDDMRRVVERMDSTIDYEFFALVEVMREVGAFEGIVGVPESVDEAEFGTTLKNKLKPAEASKLGRLLMKYDRRQIGEWRFVVEGKGHAKRFFKEALNPPQESQ